MGDTRTLDRIIFSKLVGQARYSRDLSTQTAAAVVKNGSMLSIACNNIPANVETPAYRMARPLKYMFTEHAERAAIYACADVGVPTGGAIMYALWGVCADCARAVILSGIKELVVHGFYAGEHWGESIEIAFTMLKEAGVAVREYHKPVDPAGPGLLFNGDIVKF